MTVSSAVQLCRMLFDPGTGEVLAKNGELITDVQANNIVNAGIEKVYIRAYLLVSQKSVFVLNVTVRTLPTGELVNVGEAVGIIAATVNR